MIFPTQLKGMLAAVDEGSSRFPGMNGLHVERFADSVDLTAVATDGQQLIAATWIDGDESHRGQKTATNISAKAIAKACREKKASAVRIGELPHDKEYDCDEKVTVELESLDASHNRLSLQNAEANCGRFPRWREVIPEIRVAKIVPAVDAEDRQLYHHIRLDPKKLVEMLKTFVDIADDENRAIDLFLPIADSSPIVAKYQNVDFKVTGVLMPCESDGHKEWNQEVYVASTVPESESTGVRIDVPVAVQSAEQPPVAVELSREDFGDEYQAVIDELLAEGLPLADVLAELQAALQNEETAVAL